MLNSRIVNHDFQLIAVGSYKNLPTNDGNLSDLYGPIPQEAKYLKIQSDSVIYYTMDGSEPTGGFQLPAWQEKIIPVPALKNFIIQVGATVKVQPMKEIG